MTERYWRNCLIETMEDIRKCRCPNMPNIQSDGKVHCIYAKDEDSKAIVGKNSICRYTCGEL